MQKSQLIQVLRTFSRKELRELGKWVESPAHNQRQDVVFLYEYLTEKDRLYCDEFLSKAEVFSYIYPKEDYDDARFRQTMHFFMKVVEDFLAFTEWRENEGRFNLMLAKVYRKRNFLKGFKKYVNKARSALESQPIRNELFHRGTYDILQEQYLAQSKQKRVTAYNLQELSEALDVSYLSEKLRQSCHMLTHQKVYKVDYTIGLIEPVLLYIEEKDFLKIPAVAIYYYALKTLTNVEEEIHFQHLKQQILSHEDAFPKNELRDIYLMAINYCIGKLNAGKEQFLQETFELYRKGVESFILIENGVITRWTFRNIVSAGLKVKEYEWVKQFISDYQQYLDETYKESIVHYSLGVLYSAMGDYKQAMSLFARADYKDVLLTLNAKSLLLKMYYEQDELDAMESLIESMQAYVRRKEVMGYHKQSYKNALSLTKKLIRINPYNPEQKSGLEKEVKEADPLFPGDRSWLLKQIEQF
jgi:hypothetical protein